MDQLVGADAENKLIAILKVLSESSEPLGSITIARRLAADGVFLSERGVRYHLKISDERGFTEPGGRDGRTLTAAGRQEVKDALIPSQLGLVRDKLELLAYLTTFDPVKRTGNLAINTSIIAQGNYANALAAMKESFKAGFCVSDLVATAEGGEKLGTVVVPDGKIGFATVCSASINGVLLKAGVPSEFRFGGVLEIKDNRPRRFVALTEYAGTSTDPSEQFIQAKMTSVGQAARTGSGKILGAFRTIPAPAREAVEEKAARLKEAGIRGIYALGNTSEPLCQVSVALNRVGIIQVGGLNPVAAAVEAGIEVENIAESGVIDFSRLHSFWDL
jgi:HTH-type transcriptional regulator, global nitrogen regulator NrpRI